LLARTASSLRHRSLMSWAKALNTVSGPDPTGQMTSSTGNRWPSLWTAVTSTRRFSSGPWPVSRNRRRPRSWALRDPSGMSSSVSGRPTASSLAQPKVSVAWGFQMVTSPPASIEMNASAVASRISRVRSSPSTTRCSARVRSRRARASRASPASRAEHGPGGQHGAAQLGDGGEGGAGGHVGGDRPAEAGDRLVGGDDPAGGGGALADPGPPLEGGVDQRVAAAGLQPDPRRPRGGQDHAALVGHGQPDTLGGGVVVDEVLDGVEPVGATTIPRTRPRLPSAGSRIWTAAPTTRAWPLAAVS